MKRKAIKLIAIFILAFFNLPFYAQAVTSVKITYNGQVVDSLWGVDAIYSTASKGNVDEDTTYSCAAFLKKFCSKMWGVTIYDINIVNRKPTVTITGNHTVSLKTVSTPRPGDIMQTKNYSHVAVVKAVNGSNAVLIEQNYSKIENGYRYAKKDRSVSVSSVYFYRVIIDGKEAPTPDKSNNYADLGDKFWAKIVHPATGFSVGRSQTGNVELLQSDENYKTYWYFEKQSDGTYCISAYGGGVMDVVNFGTSAGTNVSVGNFNGSTAQSWYFTQNGDRYTIKALCAETVLDVAYNHNIQMYTANGTDAQKFSIERVTPFGGWVTASTWNDVLPIYSEQDTIFKFDAAGANYFSLSLAFPDGRFEEIYTGTEKTFSKRLPAGDYVVYVNGQNNIGWTWNMGERHFRVVDSSTVLPSEGWIKINDDKSDALYTDENITFTFDAKDAFYYDLWLYKEGNEREEIYAGYDRSISKALPAGKYRLTLSALNNIGWTYEFAQVEFTVTDKPHSIKYEAEYNGRKYALYDVPLTWHEAKEYCEEQGGHLATVSDENENEFIKSFIANGGQNGYWLGATDEITEGIWKWVTGEEFLFSDWYADNPNNSGNNEHYLEIRKDYGNLWNDDCNNKFSEDVLAYQGFICEFENATPRTESTVIKTESGYTIETKFVNISDGTAIVAAYSGGRLEFVSKNPVGSDDLQIVTDGNFDLVKIMVWDSLKPLTKAEEITVTD